VRVISAVFAKLAEKFDTPAHQRQVEQIRQSLDLEKTRKMMECGRVKALGHIYFEVDRLNSQIPHNKRGDSFKSEQLILLWRTGLGLRRLRRSYFRCPYILATI